MRRLRFFQDWGWRILVTIAILLLLLLYTARTQTKTAGAQSGSDPLVLAFYYPWYDASTWANGLTSDTPAQPYASSDRAAMGRQIDQAKAAGIDAFVVAWYGPNGSNPTESNLSALLEEAAARSFRIAILLETDSPFLGDSGATAAALQHALITHAGQPAYLRVDGKPVIFMWRTNLYGVDEWQAIRDQADPNRAALWIEDGSDTSYLRVFDGHYLYSNTWNPPADLSALNARYAAQVEAYRTDAGATRYWVATAMPGYDDVRVRGGFAQDREGGGYYDRSWAAALASSPNWVVITSFNEWMEGSQIEPSATYGDQYLNQTARWSAQFKAGGGSQPAAQIATDSATDPQPADPQTADAQTADGQTADPQAAVPLMTIADAAAQPAADRTIGSESDAVAGPALLVDTELLNIRSGPGAEYPLLGSAAQGDILPVIALRGDAPGWWKVDYAGVTGWVSGEWAIAQGDMASVPAEASEDGLAVARIGTSASLTATAFITGVTTGVITASITAPITGAITGAVSAATGATPGLESLTPQYALRWATHGPHLSARP